MKKLKEKQKVLLLYIIFFIPLAIVMMSPPKISTLSFMASVLILSLIYSIRHNENENSLIYHHATYLINTFWRFNLYLVYSTFLGIAYLLATTDYSALNPCFSYTVNNFTSIIMYWEPDRYIQLFKKCAKPFVNDNKINIVISIFIIVFPIIIFLLNRFIMGWSHAIKEKPIQQNLPKNNQH